MSKRLCLDKTIDNENSASFSSISIQNIVIQSPSTYPTYTLTLPINTGAAGQVLTTNGSGVLSWSSPVAGVTSVTASLPLSSSGGATPDISLGTVPTTLGGTGLTTVGTTGQVLTSNGTTLSWQSPTSGTVTSVSVSVPSYQTVTVINATTTPSIQISGSATGSGIVALQTQPSFTDFIQITSDYITYPNLAELIKLRNDENLAQALKITFSKTTVKNELGFYFDPVNAINNYFYVTVGTKNLKFYGIADFTLPFTIGSAGQILSTDGFGNSYWINNAVGTVTSVSASVPSWLSVTVTNPTTTPAIAITGSNTGVGTTVVLNDSPFIFTPSFRQYLTLDVLTPYTGPLGKFLRESADPTIEGQNYRYLELGRYASDIMVGSDSSKFFFYRNSNTGDEFTGIRYSDKMFRFNGLANFTLPDSEGTNGQILSTNGTGVTSWINNQVGTVTSVSASVPSWLSVTVTNPTTTPAIAITGSATGTGTVSVLQDSPTINTLLTVSGDVNVNRTSSNGLGISVYNTDNTYPTSSYIAVGRNSSALNHTHFGTIINGNNDNTNYGYIQFNSNRIQLSYAGNVTIPGAIISTNPSGSANVGSFLILRDTTDVYISHYKAGSSGVLDDAFIISTGSASDSTKTYFYGRNGKVGIFNNSPITTFDVIGSIGASSFIKLNNISLYGSSLTTSLYLPTSPGTNGQVLTSAGTGNAMTWTTPTTGTVTSVSATSPLASSGGATPTISISSSTGTGAVMLQSGPSAIDYLGVKSVTPDIYLDLNTNYGQFASIECHNLANVKKPIILNGYGGNIGIGTTAPNVKFHVVNGSGETGTFEASTSYGSVVKLVATATNGRTFKLQSTASGDGQNPTGAFAIDDGTAGARRFVINDAGNISIGVSAAISSFKLAVDGAGYFNLDGQNLVLDGSTSSYLRWRVGTNNYGYMGYTYGGSKDLILYNQRTDGHIILDVANTGGAIRCAKNILLQETVYIKIGTASSTYDFILPTSPGTAGQYLISGGAGSPMYWGSGGGGGGGSVNSVTASAPLSSSGGTAPNISIASATGTGAVVLQTDPQLLGSPLMASGSGPLLRFTHDVAGGINYIQSGAAFSGGSAQDLSFGPVLSASSFMTIKANGNVGIGTTSPAAKLDVNGAVYSNSESRFSNGTYSDPDSGNSYTAKFGTSSGNGIAVKGNSKFTNSVIAANFTTNSSDFFTYATAYSLSALQMVGTNLNAGTYGYDAVAAGGGLITITGRESKLVRIGDSVTVNFYVEFTYSANPVPSYPYMCILLTNSNTNGFRNPTSSAVTLYSQAVCNYPTTIAGISNPITVTVVNVTYAGGAYVGLLVTTTNGFVQYNPSFGQANQRISGGITYNLF